MEWHWEWCEALVLFFSAKLARKQTNKQNQTTKNPKTTSKNKPMKEIVLLCVIPKRPFYHVSGHAQTHLWLLHLSISHQKLKLALTGKQSTDQLCSNHSKNHLRASTAQVYLALDLAPYLAKISEHCSYRPLREPRKKRAAEKGNTQGRTCPSIFPWLLKILLV